MIGISKALQGAAAFGTVILGLLMGVQSGLTEDTNFCIECHSMINEEIVASFEDDVHAHAGLSCVDCHGGDASLDDESGMGSDLGFIGVPDRGDQPQFCGKCHSDPNYMRAYDPSLPTDQVDKYWTSHHGQLLKERDDKVATCASCHRAHSILPADVPNSSVYPLNVPETCASCHADDEYMAQYDIPTTQYEQFADSSNVHGYALLVKRDIGAPACNDCHGNHGANPPGVEDVAQVCMQCHSLNGELFRKSPHKDAFDAFEVSECAFCHQKNPDLSEPNSRIHTIVNPTPKLIGVNDNAVCGQCHSEGDGGWNTARTISLWRDSLDARLGRAQEMLATVEARGLEVSDAKWELDSEVKQALMTLRTGIHTFDLNSYAPVYVKADTTLSKVLVAGQEAKVEVGGRRLYFVIITVVIAVMVIALVMKIRDIERSSI